MKVWVVAFADEEGAVVVGVAASREAAERMQAKRTREVGYDQQCWSPDVAGPFEVRGLRRKPSAARVFGAKGGRSTSEAKAAAARANGAKGGRPKRQP